MNILLQAFYKHTLSGTNSEQRTHPIRDSRFHKYSLIMDGKLSEKHEKHEEKSEWHQKGGDSSTSWQRVMKVTKKTETKMSSKTEQKTRTYKVIDLTGSYTYFL